MKNKLSISKACHGEVVTVKSGRPAELVGGKRVNVFLDEDSLVKASAIGGGNASLGIRIALAKQQERLAATS